MSITLQEIFTQGLEHLRKQKEPAMAEGGSCRYLDTKTGNRCLVGFFIPAHLYQSRWEGDDADQADLLEAIGFEGTSGDLVDMQRALHDSPSKSPSQFLDLIEKGARQYAFENGLTYTPPTS